MTVRTKIYKTSLNLSLNCYWIKLFYNIPLLCFRSAIELKNSYIMNIVNSFDKVKSIDSEIKQHKERNVQRDMDKIKEANEKLMEKQKQIMIDRDALTKRIDTLKDELAKQDVSSSPRTIKFDLYYS